MKIKVGNYILNSDSLNLENEQWKPIKGYEGLYEISNMGHIRNKDKKMLKPQNNGKGYLKIFLSDGNGKKRHYIHRLVAEAFTKKKEGANIVNHLDECPCNNTASNLEWTTNKENLAYGTAPERHKKNINEYWKTHKSSQRKNVLCVETNVVFDSICDAAEATNAYRANLTKCLKGERHTAGGYHWRLVEVSK